MNIPGNIDPCCKRAVKIKKADMQMEADEITYTKSPPRPQCRKRKFNDADFRLPQQGELNSPKDRFFTMQRFF
jgi:hypothetical protein